MRVAFAMAVDALRGGRPMRLAALVTGCAGGAGMGARQRKVRECVINQRRIELDEIGGAALMLRMAGAAL